MIYLDGARGEGGGQVLRTALALSLVTGKAFTINHIRGKRKKPGLMRQHLTAVLAAAEIGRAQVRGAEICSDYLEFIPNSVRPGSYRFAIGTAGSCTLVLQTVLPALLLAQEPSELVVEGGTHNPLAPPFDFLHVTFLPLLQKMGADVRTVLERPGFNPAGGGRMRISITPVAELKVLDLSKRGPVSVTARALSAELPEHIGRRELAVVQEKLNIGDEDVELVQLDGYGPGNSISVFVHSEQLTETFTGFGEKFMRAEKIANRLVRQVKEYIESEAPVGMYLADQLLIPMALAGAGGFRTNRLTLHAVTNMEVIWRFLDIRCTVTEDSYGNHLVRIAKG